MGIFFFDAFVRDKIDRNFVAWQQSEGKVCSRGGA